jgi:MFS family permease
MSEVRSELIAGWRNLSAATLGSACGIAIYTPLFSLFFRALEVERGWSKVAAAGSLFAMVATALVLPFVGRLIDRLGTRPVIGFSVGAMVACYLWLALRDGSITEFYIATVALSILGCATGPIGYTRIVVRQFDAARGTALAITLAGQALLTIILPPIVANVIAEGSSRDGYILMAGLAGIGGYTALALMKPPVQRVVNSSDDLEGADVRTAIRTIAFWRLTLATFAISAASIGLVSQLQSVLIEKGLSASAAVLLISCLGLSVVVSRLVTGRLLDLRRPDLTAAGCMALAAIGALVLLKSDGHPALAILAVVLVGISLGAELDIVSFFVSRIFGLRHYGALYGVLSLFLYLGMAGGGLAYALVRQHWGSYDGAIAGSCTLLLTATFLLWGLAKRPRAGAS